MASQDELSKEVQTYNDHVSEWGGHEGEYVLIRGTRVVGFFEGYEEALSHGYSEFGVVPFLVKKILPEPRVIQVSRLAAPHIVR